MLHHTIIIHFFRKFFIHFLFNIIQEPSIIPTIILCIVSMISTWEIFCQFVFSHIYLCWGGGVHQTKTNMGVCMWRMTLNMQVCGLVVVGRYAVLVLVCWRHTDGGQVRPWGIEVHLNYLSGVLARVRFRELLNYFIRFKDKSVNNIF